MSLVVFGLLYDTFINAMQIVLTLVIGNSFNIIAISL